MRHLATLVLLIPLALSATPALARPKTPSHPPEPASEVAPALVFSLRTGPADPQAAIAAFRQAKVVNQSGLLGGVSVMVFGGATVYLDPARTPDDDPVITAMNEARAAGVRILGCEQALAKNQIAKEAAATRAEIVPQGILEIARSIAEGAEVLNY